MTASVVLTLPKNIQYVDDPERYPTMGDGDDLMVVEALSVIRERLLDPGLRSFVAYVAMFFGVTATVDAFV